MIHPFNFCSWECCSLCIFTTSWTWIVPSTPPPRREQAYQQRTSRGRPDIAQPHPNIRIHPHRQLFITKSLRASPDITDRRQGQHWCFQDIFWRRFRDGWKGETQDMVTRWYSHQQKPTSSQRGYCWKYDGHVRTLWLVFS